MSNSTTDERPCEHCGHPEQAHRASDKVCPFITLGKNERGELTIVDRGFDFSKLCFGTTFTYTPDCVCGHASHVHQSDPSGSGNTPCWDTDDGKADQYGYPINRCPCGEYTPQEDTHPVEPTGNLTIGGIPEADLDSMIAATTEYAAETLIAEILDAACPNGGTDENGNNIYVIETHCVAWQITAKKIGGRWHIIKSEPEPC